MNHFSKVFLASLLGIVAIASSASGAMAGTGGQYQMGSLEYVYNLTWTLQANVSYTIKATATGAIDPILHVQDYPSGDFLAGNDDYSGLSPQVTIPAVGSTRNVWVVVRAYSAGTEGTATFQIIPSSGSTYTTTIAVNSGTVYSMASYRAGSHFSTVEKQGGTNNTIILALSGNQETGVAYDDFDGVRYMSSVHTPVACTSNCKIVVANRYASGGLSATYVWDEDVHYNDSDGDYLSNALEAALTTDPYAVDTDEDGLEDMAEVMGVDTTDSLLRLPYYGADPKKPDVFVQADWMACDSAVEYCGPSNDPGFFRLNATNATAVAGKYLDPNGQPTEQVHTHVDTGIANTNSATWHDSGAWEGATQHSTWTAGKCDWMDVNDTRKGYFHFARLKATGGQSTQPGLCFDASNHNDGGTFAHELGHNFGLSERASQSGTVEAWCKPNYRSLMNYAVSSSNHNFSSGQFLSVPLNPTEMDEEFGLGTANATLIDYITATFEYTTGPNGEIDWNRNGTIEQGLVRAAPNWTWSSCKVGGYQADGCTDPDTCRGVWAERAGSAFAWLPTTGGNRLYWFTRRESDGYIEYRYATSFPENCGTPPDAACKTTWVPALSQSAYALSATNSTTAPAVARYWDSPSGGYKLALVYRESSGLMSYRTYSATTGWTNAASMPGSTSVRGDVAAATYGTQAYFYAIGSVNSTLYKWTRQNTGTWTGPATQVWSTPGSPTVLAKYGVAVTSGQSREGAVRTTRMFGAIPLASPLGKLAFAWNTPSTNTWTALPDADWTRGTHTTTAQPGLAYVPMEPTETTGPGRFYVAWTPPDNANGKVPMQMAMTEGNDFASASAEQLRWEAVTADLEGDWSYGKANISLHYDLTYDHNMRASFTQEYQPKCTSDTDCPVGVCTNNLCSVIYRALTFEPFADGIYDNILGDQDDYPVLLENLDNQLILQ